jgi:acyl dehydratase
MPLQSKSVGIAGEPVRDLVEDRWTMNYAASVYDHNPVYYENRDTTPPVHPTYVSHLEWDAIGTLHECLEGITADERLQGVHSYNHTVLHSAFAPGCELTSTATLVGVDRRRSGARLTSRIDTTCAGRPVATSNTSTIFRGVGVLGDDVVPVLPESAGSATGEPTRTEQIEMTALSPYHFSECARDYGAIHTDRAAAEKAGLPGLILHGTGTFAYALSSITNHEAGGNPDRVIGFEGRLGAMVLCPSTVTLRTFAAHDAVRFELVNQDGDLAIARGAVRLGNR